MCSSGIGLDPVQGGKVLTFGFEGTWQGTLVLYDRGTQSVWLHLTGECIDGARQGNRLSLIPCRHVTWAEWRRDHPDTEVLALNNKVQTFSRISVERGGISLPHGFASTMQDRHSAFPLWRLVLGVDVGGQSIAYDMNGLRRRPGGLLNDSFNGEPILVGADPRTGSPFAYSRVVADRTVTFEPQQAGQFWDPDTGSIFSHDGICISGELAGRRLTPLQSLLCEWYGWYASRPGTAVWDAKGRLRDAPVSVKPGDLQSGQRSRTD